MSAEYMQSAQRARALIEEIGAEKFGQDMSAKTTWLYEAAYQVEKVIKELFKTIEDQDQVTQVQGALEHTTTNEYMQGTLTNLADVGGTLVFTASIKEIFSCIKSMIMETWKTHQDLKRQDVFWDEPDFLLIDMPPGTGDIALSLSQYLPRGEVFVVTTPQPAAQKVAAMSAAMAEKVNLPVRGVIENMSWFTGDDGKKYEIFGSGGGQALADDVGVPLIGQLPLVPALREGGDDGKPITAVDPESESAKIFHEMARQIAVDMKPKKIYSPELKIL
jgi:hypothetical protein